MPHIVLKKQLIDLNNPIVMAIINITPDSFYADSRSKNTQDIITKCEKAINNGAKIIDISVYSTRPNANYFSLELNNERVKEAYTVNIQL